MAASSTGTIISCCCCLGAPSQPKETATSVRTPSPAGVSVSLYASRRACVVAAACALMGMTGGGGAADMALALSRGGTVASRIDAVAMGAAAVKPRWSDRRQCPPWRANSLENVVPENLPRPSAPRRFNSVSSVSAAEGGAAAPDLVALAPPAPPSLALRPGGTACFSL